MTERRPHHPAINRLALILGIVTLVIVVYWVSFGSMWDLWQTTDHRHGILVFPISAFLVWRLRHELGVIPLHVDASGLLLILPITGLWVIARFAGVQVVEHFAVLAMIPAIVLTLTGMDITRKLWFPLMFLVLATPLGDALVPFLMVVTADISTALLKLTAIPVLRSGQYLSLPGGDFVVADVCSGLRYLVTGFMISLLFGYLTYSSLLKRAILIGSTALILVVANGVRAYIVMVIASATDMQYLGGRDHVYFGWILFGIVMMLIMWFAVRYSDDAEAVDSGGESTIIVRASHTALPMIAALGLIMLAMTIKPLQADFGDLGTMLAAAAALLVFVFLLIRDTSRNSEVVSATGSDVAGLRPLNIVVVAATVGLLVMTPRFVHGVEEAARQISVPDGLTANLPCTQAGDWSNNWRPDFKSPDAEQALAVNCGGRTVNVYTAAYASALQGRELISSSNHAVPARWNRYSTTRPRELARTDGGTKEFVEVVVSSEAYAAMVWYWYDIDGRIATNPYKVKLLQAVALASKRPAGGRVVVIETPLLGNTEASRARLEQIAGVLMANGDSS